MIVWDVNDIIAMFIIGGVLVVSLLLGVVYVIKRGIDRVVTRLRGEKNIDDEDTE